jgi:predicted molibdopterin-dependent oxidoreductase YjgC
LPACPAPTLECAVMQDILTTCAYCGCGCGLYLHVENNRVIGAAASRHHPISRNNLCVKGWHVADFIHDPARLTEPLMKKKGELTRVSWDEALDFTARQLRKIRDDSNGGGIGVLASAKCTNEENYLLQKLTRAVLGSNNIDHCARL